MKIPMEPKKIRDSSNGLSLKERERQHFIRRICKKAKVKPFGFHAIRHLAATVQYHKGQGLNWLQAFLRYKNATTTEKYLKIWDSNLSGRVLMKVSKD